MVLPNKPRVIWRFEFQTPIPPSPSSKQKGEKYKSQYTREYPEAKRKLLERTLEVKDDRAL